MTREQELVIERLARQHGRVHVGRPYADETVEVTVPGGQSWVVTHDGTTHDRPSDVRAGVLA